jgi:hypothetical protein
MNEEEKTIDPSDKILDSMVLKNDLVHSPTKSNQSNKQMD